MDYWLITAEMFDRSFAVGGEFKNLKLYKDSVWPKVLSPACEITVNSAEGLL